MVHLFALLLLATHPAQAVLDAQASAWNRGDLEGYMAGYWRSPELTFYSGGTATRGWEPTMARYKKRYQAPGSQMGEAYRGGGSTGSARRGGKPPPMMGALKFEDVTFEVLGPDHALARGRWHLTMPGGETPHGLFSLVLRKFPEGWRIVHDHTSVEVEAKKP